MGKGIEDRARKKSRNQIEKVSKQRIKLAKSRLRESTNQVEG